MWEDAGLWAQIKEYEDAHSSEVFIDMLLKYRKTDFKFYQHLCKIFETRYKNKYGKPA